jgi:phosphate transport system permease protein
MRNFQYRKWIDRLFTWLSLGSIFLLATALFIILLPIIFQGAGAFLFTGTIEHRRVNFELFDRGSRASLHEQLERAHQARQPLFDAIVEYEKELSASEGKEDESTKATDSEFGDLMKQLEGGAGGEGGEINFDEMIQAMDQAEDKAKKQAAEKEAKKEEPVEIAKKELEKLKEKLRELFGPLPMDEDVLASVAGSKSSDELLLRDHFGETRWARAVEQLDRILYAQEWIPNPEDPDGKLIAREVSRKKAFQGTPLESVFDDYLTEEHLRKMMLPEFTFYYGFFLDHNYDSHIFGGIRQEIIGTFYLTVGAMLIAAPLGVLAAIYLAEYAREGPFVSVIRSCIGTLAGVPSIVFGLFGLAFFLSAGSWFRISQTKSVAAGSCTLALLILPTIICAAEEAIRAVPVTYKEAALGLGSSRWKTVWTVMLPAALPGILTGVVLSMGRAAGETAPIIFTAAVSVGSVPLLAEVFSSPTPALPWAIYSLTAEHEAAEKVRHVQFGMTLTLIVLVLALNLVAILLRGYILKKLRG